MIREKPIRLAVVGGEGQILNKIQEMLLLSNIEHISLDGTPDFSIAVDLFEKKKVDAILIDNSTNKRDKTDIQEKIRFHSSDIPLLVIVGNEDESFAIRAIHAGAQDYLVKDSFSAHTFSHVVNSAIERHRVSVDLEKKSKEFQANEARFLNVIINNIEGIVVIDTEKTVLFVNAAAEKLLNKSAVELLGKSFEYSFVLKNNCEISIKADKDKSIIVELCAIETEWEGKNAHLISMRDITARKRAEDTLRKSEERYALAVRGSKDGLWDWNLESDDVYYSPRWKAILGYSRNEISASPNEWLKRVHAEDIDRLRTDIAAHLNGHTPHFENEHRLMHKDGSYRWILSRGTAVRNNSGKAVRIAGSQSDITDRKEAEKNLKRALSDLKFALASEKVLLDELDRRNKELVALSITDGLTGLYNHRFIQERFDFEFKRARRYDVLLSCLLIDIDHFKAVNDTYGHQFGDMVLREIATILRTQSREVDICGRYGGEEFMIISNQNAEGALRYATKLHTAIENHVFKSEEHSVHITVSIGVAEWKKDILTKQELIERADTALYQAKEDGRNLIRVWKSIKRSEESAIDQGGIEDLKEKFDSLSSKIRATYVESTHALLRAIDARDHYTQEHSQNVSNYAVEIAKAMDLREEEVEVVKYAGLLHDIGKIGINQDILIKKEALTEKEFEILKRHPTIGVNILKDVNFLEKEIPIIMHHHERYDGAGYPQGLKGREIPLGARILCVADSFDAMTTDREFKVKRSLNEAIKELKHGKGTQFAPDIVDIFIGVIEKKVSETGHFYKVQ